MARRLDPDVPCRDKHLSVHLIGQSALHKRTELLLGEVHLFRHRCTEIVVKIALIRANLGVDVSLLAPVVKENNSCDLDYYPP